jgi:hypothetical protein
VQRVSILVCLIFALVGCSYRPPAGEMSKVAVKATPEVVAAQLHPVVALPEAAADLARELGVSPDQVRVRMQLKSCITCNLNQHAAASSLEGLPVEAAAEQLEPDITLWLFVQDFICTYSYDGRYLRPRQCQISPL